MPAKRIQEPEDSNTHAFTVRFPQDEYEALRGYSYATNSSYNEVIRKAVLTFLAQSGREEEIDAIIARIRDTRRLALDKLADM